MSGPENLRGVDYQITYTMFRILELIKSEKEEIQYVQFESLNEEEEDFNIIRKNGNIDYIQVKKRMEGYHWTPSDLKVIFENFYYKKGSNVRFYFVTNGGGNTDVSELKRILQKGTIPSDELISKFITNNLNISLLKDILPNVNLQTFQFTSDKDEDPAYIIRREVFKLMNEPPFFLVKEINDVYDVIWKYIFDLSKKSCKVKLKDIVNHLEQVGLKIFESKVWFQLPDLTNFIGRKNECSDIINLLNERKKVIIQGISGIGKTLMAAKIAKELELLGKNACWISLNLLLDKKKVISYVSTYLWDIGLKQESNLLLTSEEYYLIPRLVDIIKNNEIYIFLDSLEKAQIDSRKLIDELLSELVKLEIKGGLLITSNERPDFYTDIDVVTNKIIEYNLKGFSVEDCNLALKESNKFINEEILNDFYDSTGGYPLSVVFLKQLISDEALSKIEWEKIKYYSIESSRKWIFEKVFNTLSSEQQSTLLTISIFNYPFNEHEAECLIDNVSIKLKYIFQNLVNRNVLSFDGTNYYIHDYVRFLTYDMLNKHSKVDLHIRSKDYYMDNIKKLTDVDRDAIFKWGYHVERLFTYDKSKVDTMYRTLLELDDKYLETLWGILLQGFPFEYEDSELKSTEKRIKELIQKELVIKNENASSDNNQKEYLLNSFQIFDMFLLEYLVITRGLSNYLGYVEMFTPNYAFMRQKIICHWEHCIEYMPLERGDESCPIFGHDCPGGINQASECRQIMNEDK